MSNLNWRDSKETPPRSLFGYSVPLILKLSTGEEVKGYFSFRDWLYYHENHDVVLEHIEGWIALGKEELTTINYPITNA